MCDLLYPCLPHIHSTNISAVRSLLYIHPHWVPLLRSRGFRISSTHSLWIDLIGRDSSCRHELISWSTLDESYRYSSSEEFCYMFTVFFADNAANTSRIVPKYSQMNSSTNRRGSFSARILVISFFGWFTNSHLRKLSHSGIHISATGARWMIFGLLSPETLPRQSVRKTWKTEAQIYRSAWGG